MIRQYIATDTGQIHLRIWPPPADAAAPPLICLHAMPYSGLHFASLAPLLADQRLVICPDYPGYGGSDPLPDPPRIEDFAKAMLGCLDAMNIEGPVDLLGFHTGCLVGPEMALQSPQRIRRLVLIDVPCFETTLRRELGEKNGRPPEYTADLGCLQPAWDMNVSSKLDQLEMNRCLELLAEQLRPGDRVNLGFRAAFSYDCEARLALVRHPCRLIATRSTLADPTRNAASLLVRADFREMPELGPPVLETGAAELAAAARQYLDAEPPGLDNRQVSD